MSPFPSTQPLTLAAADESTPTQTGDDHGVALHYTGTGVKVTSHGKVDCADGPALAAARALANTWQEQPVVDASAVTFIDAAGLRAVLSPAREGAALLLLTCSPAFCALVALVGT